MSSKGKYGRFVPLDHIPNQRDFTQTDMDKIAKTLQSHKIEIFEKLLREDPTFIYIRGSSGEYLLNILIMLNWLEGVQLLAIGASVPGFIEYKGTSGLTALLLSSSKNESLEITKYLLRIGANILARDLNGSTSLHIAIKNKCFQTAVCLMDSPEVINTQDNEGKTPLHKSIQVGSHEISTALVNKGANIEETDKKGVTPLIEAIVNRRKDTVEFLILRKANVNVQDQLGMTPLMLSTLFLPEAVDLLIDNGAEVNILNKQNMSALAIAITNDDERLCQKLIDRGACVKVLDDKGVHPMQLAKRHNANKVMPIIRAAGIREYQLQEHVSQSLQPQAAQQTQNIPQGQNPLQQSIQ